MAGGLEPKDDITGQLFARPLASVARMDFVALCPIKGFESTQYPFPEMTTKFGRRSMLESYPLDLPELDFEAMNSWLKDISSQVKLPMLQQGILAMRLALQMGQIVPHRRDSLKFSRNLIIIFFAFSLSRKR